MTDKEKLIKIKSLADKMSDTAFNLTTDASLLKKAMDEYHQFIINEYHKEEQVIKELQEEPVNNNYSVVLLPCIYNRTLEERVKYCKYCSAACEGRVKEPVSENLEKAAKDYSNNLDNIYGSIGKQTRNAFKAGAEWQKKHENPASEEFEKALADEWKGYIDRGAATVDALEDNTQELAFAKGFYRGSKWKETQMMKDATEVAIHIDAGGYPYTPEIELYDYDKDVPLAKEGDKYKVILIKEE